MPLKAKLFFLNSSNKAIVCPPVCILFQRGIPSNQKLVQQHQNCSPLWQRVSVQLFAWKDVFLETTARAPSTAGSRWISRIEWDFRLCLRLKLWVRIFNWFSLIWKQSSFWTTNDHLLDLYNQKRLSWMDGLCRLERPTRYTWSLKKN